MRASLKHEDSMKSGVGFVEGKILIVKSVCAVFQYPPNSKTNEQSAAFCAVVWDGFKLNDDFSDLDEPEPVQVVIRLHSLDSLRPGKLEPKDFDNMEAEPEDLGDEVGTEGNCVFAEPGKKTGGNWGAMEESMRKKGWKAEIAARGILTDFVNTRAEFETITTSRTYKNKATGEDVKATELVCKKIHTFGYEVKKGAKPVAGAKGKAGATATPTPAATDNSEAKALLLTILGDLSPRFRKAVPEGKEIARADFQKQMSMEFMLKKANPKLNKAMQDLLKSDESLVEIAGEAGFIVDLDSDPNTVTI